MSVSSSSNSSSDLDISEYSSDDGSDESDCKASDDSSLEKEHIRCCFKDIHNDGCCCVTWKLLIQDITIRSIQEPISEMLIEKREFTEAYGKFLITLDGRDMTSYVDFFWRRSPVDCSCLEFVDRDARMDIYEYLRDEDLIPDMKRVHSGDWKFQKNKPK